MTDRQVLDDESTFTPRRNLCGDRWSDPRRWYNENRQFLLVPSAAKASWDRRLLYRLFECWLRLFRKQSWDDLDRVAPTRALTAQITRRLRRDFEPIGIRN